MMNLSKEERLKEMKEEDKQIYFKITAEDIENSKKRRDKNVLTLKQRIEVIKEYPSCPSARLLSEKYNCGKTQILNIMRNKEEYLKLWERESVRRPTARPNALLYLSLELILNEWVDRAKAYSNTITLHSIRRKAKEISKVLGINLFYPSSRWLQRFRKKYDITDECLVTNPDEFMKLELKSLKIEDIISELKSDMLPHLLVPASSSKQNNHTKNISIDGPMRASNIESSDLSDDSSISEFRYPIITSATTVNETFKKKFPNSTPMMTNTENCTNNDNGNKKNDQCMNNESDDDVELVEILPDTAYHSSDDYDNNSFRRNVCSENSNDNNSRSIMNNLSTGITTYTEALNFLKHLEDFAFLKQDMRATGMINQLENYFKDCVAESK